MNKLQHVGWVETQLGLCTRSTELVADIVVLGLDPAYVTGEIESSPMSHTGVSEAAISDRAGYPLS